MKLFHRARQDAGEPSDGVVQETPLATSEVIQVSGVKIAIALTWSGVQNSAEARRFAGKNNAYLVCDVGGDVTVARGDKATIGVIAGGALVGRIVPDAFVYHKLSDDRYWICLIRDGVPYPAYDRVVSAQEASKAYTNASSIAAAGTRLIGDIAPAAQTLTEALGMANALSKKERDACRLRKNGIQRRTAMTTVGIIAALAASVHLGIEHREKLQNERKRQDMLRALLQSQQERDREAARIAKARRDFQAKSDQQKALFRTTSATQQQWAQCESLRQNLPFTHSGYKPVKLTCDFDARMATVEWQAAGQRTRVADRARLPGVVDPLDVGSLVVSSFDLAPLTATEVKTSGISLKQARMDIADWAQANLGNGIRLAPDELVTLNPPPDIKGLDGVNSVTLGSKVPLDINVTSSKDVLMLAEAMRYLGAFPVSFQKMVWSSPTAPGAQFIGESTLFIRQ